VDGWAEHRREPKFHFCVGQQLTNGLKNGPLSLAFWLLGVPIPILLLIWAFGGLN
jgi:hypothetical protein